MVGIVCPSGSSSPVLRLREAYEAVADKALTTPTDTSHLYELKEYIEKVQSKELQGMEDRILKSRNRLLTLAELMPFTHADMMKNRETLKWLDRIYPIFDEHMEIITRNRREAEEALKVCCVCVCVWCVCVCVCVCVCGVCVCVCVVCVCLCVVCV